MTRATLGFLKTEHEADLVQAAIMSIFNKCSFHFEIGQVRVDDDFEIAVSTSHVFTDADDKPEPSQEAAVLRLFSSTLVELLASVLVKGE